VLPSLVPLVINFVDARTDVLVPAQAWFGPPAVLGYVWLRRRYGKERSVREFLDSPDFIGRKPRAAPVAVTVPASVPAPAAAPVPAPEPVGTSAAASAAAPAG
jgi:hypothetical protein